MVKYHLNMSYKIKSLPLLKYYGLHKEKLKFYFGFKKRLVANDYNHKLIKRNFEQFYYQVIILERLENHLLNDVNFYVLSTSAREKLTQLLIVANDIYNKINAIETQLNQNTKRQFNLTEEYFSVLNLIELFVLKLISFLDILSKMSAYFFKIKPGVKVPDKYGRQKAFDKKRGKFINSFDVDYQNRLLKNKVINELHGYRNKFSHESSLKVIPFFNNEKWILALGEGKQEGIKIKEAVKKSISELSRFIKYFENYYIRFLPR